MFCKYFFCVLSVFVCMFVVFVSFRFFVNMAMSRADHRGLFDGDGSGKDRTGQGMGRAGGRGAGGGGKSS